MDIVLADVAPEPEFAAGTTVVVVLIGIAVFAALIVLVIWLQRRRTMKPQTMKPQTMKPQTMKPQTMKLWRRSPRTTAR